MQVCIFGAGAIGSHLAVRMIATKSADVSIVGRGAHLDAIRARGLILRSEGKDTHVRVAAATDNAADLPPNDLVIVTLKAHSMPGAAGSVSRLIKPGGCALFLSNGIPWWWRHGLNGIQGPLHLLDPHGSLWTDLGPERVLGGVVYSANEVVEPGMVCHRDQNRWLLGEPSGRSSARLEAAAGLLAAAGLTAQMSADIRRDIWAKLLINAPVSTIAALTRLDTIEMSQDVDLLNLRKSIVRETLDVGAALGWDLRPQTDVEKPNRPNSGAKGLRASMLQDALAGRPMEVEAILGQVREFAREVNVPTPVIDVVLPLLRGLDRADRVG